MFSGGVVETSGKAPSWGRPALRAGNRNSLARLRRTAASFDLRCRFVKGGVPPFHTFPPVMRAANLRFAAILFFRLLGGNGWSAGLRPASRGSAKPAPTTPRPANLTVERRPPDRHRAGARNQRRRRCRSLTGIARERETSTAPPISRWSAGLPTGIARERETSADDAGPANLTVERRSPDRHRAGARNPHRQRWPRQSHGQERRSPTGIARERETSADDAGPANLTVERRSPTGIARERETRTDNAGHANLTARSAGL